MRVLKPLAGLVLANLLINTALADCTPRSLRLAVIPITVGWRQSARPNMRRCSK